MIKMKPLLIICMIVSGLVPMGVASLIITSQADKNLEKATFSRLKVDVANRQTYVENYIDVLRSQTGTLAQNPSVIKAMQNFSVSFPQLGTALKETEVDPGSIKEAVQRFYDREFMPLLNEATGTKNSAHDLIPQSDAGIMAQNLYLVENGNPVGSKDALITHSSSDAYGRHHAEYHEMFRIYLQEFGFYDIFLIEPEQGNIVYSVYKETDFGASLFNGPHRDSNLAEVTRRALKLAPGKVAVVDFQRYTPSLNAPAAFFATAVYKNNKAIGVLAFQAPVDRLNNIMAMKEGLGETGESMLLGADNLMRSQARFGAEHSILNKKVETGALGPALAGGHGTLLETMDGIEYLTAYAKIKSDDLNWAVVTRIQAEEAMGSISALHKTGLWVAVMSTIAVALFAILLGQYFYRMLGRDPQDMIRIAKSIAGGNLNDAHDDENAKGAYGQLVAMRANLREILHEANAIARDVKAGSDEISEGNIGLSERTEQQANNLEETGASTEELTSTVKQNAENARSANDLAIDTKKRAESSGDVSSQAITAMQEISSASERIVDIIGVIDEIAFQTNLLALNAAVEAARAGEQGRGFAVVASEVRQLAGRSASAAKEIKGLIEDSVTKVKDGTNLVTKSGDELKLIVGLVSQLTNIVGQIAVATDEQAIGIDQINQALVYMDTVTQQNAALVREAATTSNTMSNNAKLLTSKIDYFSVEDKVAQSNQPTPSLEIPIELSKPTPPVWQPGELNASPENIAANHNIMSPVAIKRASGNDVVWDDF